MFLLRADFPVESRLMFGMMLKIYLLLGEEKKCVCLYKGCGGLKNSFGVNGKRTRTRNDPAVKYLNLLLAHVIYLVNT